jgi:hypothetical protein
MADRTEQTRGGWLQADPDQLDRFADDLDELIVFLERVRDKAGDAASFLAPSMDPATIRTTQHLAADAHGLADRPTPVGVIAAAIDDLVKQVMAARLAARDYRAHQEESVGRFGTAGGMS